MPSWLWWIDLARWHTSFPQRMKPQLKRRGDCSSPTFSSIMVFPRTKSDQDPKFTSKFWRALWKRMGSELKMSTSFRPQTDGQTERVNLVIQQFLRNYVAVDQQDWVDHLELAEFCYNNSEHSAIGSTPFQMVMGKSPIVPMTWVAQGQPSSDASEEVLMVTQLDEERKHLWELAKVNL